MKFGQGKQNSPGGRVFTVRLRKTMRPIARTFQLSNLVGYGWGLCMCQPSRNRAGNPAFRLSSCIFAKTSRIFSFISEKNKFSENPDNFQRHKHILWTMRNIYAKTPGMQCF